MQHIRIYFLSLALFIFLFNTLHAQDADKNGSLKQYQRYEDIKKEHNKDFKKGAYKDGKKDYVKKWIDEDISYQKRVIKLKSDYREWAIERQSAGKEVIFMEYEPVKNLTTAEKEILLEYHNNFFKSKDRGGFKKTAEVKKTVRKKPKKLDQKSVAGPLKKSEEKKQDEVLQQIETQTASTAEGNKSENTEVGSSIYMYMILGFALLLIITECVYLIVKRIK